MPLELGIWRIDNGLDRMQVSSLELESRLEDILHQEITIASPNWLVIGRQVQTDYGKFIDLLAIDPDGNLVVIELKRDKTHRDIVAQALDYGATNSATKTSHAFSATSISSQRQRCLSDLAK